MTSLAELQPNLDILVYPSCIGVNYMSYATGEKHGIWKGDDVGIGALTAWIRRNMPKPDLCQACGVNPSWKVKNITGVYNRDFVNWQWLCSKCKTQKAESNGNWKGDDVKYMAVHSWLNRNFPITGLCETCHERPAIQRANISGEYKRDPKDYKCLCRQCHMDYDNMIRRGEENPASKLNERQVLEIKRRAMEAKITHKETLVDIAKEFGVSTGTVFNIKHGVNWKYLKDDKDVPT
jgi:protein-arginine kinase activator protein McsA